MTRDDIMKMAKAAGFADTFDDVHAFYQLEHFATLVAAAEREACAVACDEQGYFSAGLCAEKIRARSLHEVNAELLAALKNLIVRYQGKKQGVWGESTPEMLSARAAVLKAIGVTE